jgi:hypothetical protein
MKAEERTAGLQVRDDPTRRKCSKMEPPMNSRKIELSGTSSVAIGKKKESNVSRRRDSSAAGDP